MKQRCLYVTESILLLVHVFVTFCSIPSAASLLSRIGTQPSQGAYFTYPIGIRGERELPECSGLGAVCNEIRRPFALPTVVVRRCRCTKTDECPYKWTGMNDEFTMPLDSRSQLKFCEPITDLPECEQEEEALHHVRRTTSVAAGTPMVTEHTGVTCKCPNRRYWNLLSNDTIDFKNGTIDNRETYACEQLTRCATGDFCANIRADTFSSAYRCSCPQYHLCLPLPNDSGQSLANELLFHGSVYKGLCTRYPPKD